MLSRILTRYINRALIINMFIEGNQNKTDSDFGKLTENELQYENHYEKNSNCFCRSIFLKNSLDCLLDTRKKVKALEEDEEKGANKGILNVSDVPNIKFDDTSIELAKNLDQYIYQNMQKSEEPEITSGIIYKSLIDANFSKVIFLIIFATIQVLCRLGTVVILKLLLEIVLELQGQNIATAYLYALLLGVIWSIGIIMRQKTIYDTKILVQRIRGALVMLIFKKVSGLTQYTAKNQELGKIINMLSNDFNEIQMKSSFVFSALVTPLMIIGIFIILIINLGWVGIVSPLVVMILIPIQFLIGRKNGSLYGEVNVEKDKRIKLSTDIIENIKSIKFYGWERAFKKLIQVLRNEEINKYIKLSLGRSFEKALGNLTSIWAALVCFLILEFTDQGEELTGSNVFTTLQIIMNLRIYLSYLGISSGFYFQVNVIFDRYCSIFNIKNETMKKIQDPKSEKKLQSVEIISLLNDNTEESSKSSEQKGYIKFTNFNGFWKKDERKEPTLKNINLQIKHGEFYGITGKIGSGKSGLFGALINELPYYSGSIEKQGEIILIEQEPVIFSASIKQNVLFGLEYDDDRYKRCIYDSCLKADIEMFENQDERIVGEKGADLSGGQRVRLALARALYADADIYLFDDPISAVDSKVAKQIYENVILKLKGEKTVVLVTHQVSYLEHCDKVIIMEDGKILHNDTFDELKKELNEFEISEHQQDMIDDGNSDEEQQRISLESQMKRRRRLSYQTQKTEKMEKSENKDLKKEEQDIKISGKSYIEYLFITKTNYFLFPFAVVLFLIAQGFNIGFYRLLAGYDDLKAGKHDMFTEIEEYWGIINLFVMLFFIFSVLKYFLLNLVILISNKDLHSKMIESILRSESAFFDVTSIGQLINKFSNDLGVLDNNLAFLFVAGIEGPIITLVMLGNIFAIDYYFLIPGVVNIIVIVIFFIIAKNTIVKCKQLDLRIKTSIFSMINEVLSGLVPIRIFRNRFNFLKKFSGLVNDMFRSRLSFTLTLTAFGAYVSYSSALLLMIGFITGVYNIERVQDKQSRASIAGLYGVSIIFLTYISDILSTFLKQILIISSMMVSYERSNLITNLKPEKDLVTDYDKSIGRVDNNSQQGQQHSTCIIMPKNSCLKLQNFSYRYRPELPLVLKKINLTIKDKEKVGIVGRTGAGKSSIIQALFRISQPEEGSIFQIQGSDALKMGLSTLRHMISVIPQTPFLFTGTIRKNIDPEDIYEEQKIWDALEGAGLKEKINDMPEQLQTYVANASQVFSVGEKQLICLARAILRNANYLVLDEATANVDMQTDSFIQKCIHTKFSETTVITIAHRLNTISNYDRIIVMSKGRIVENGSPHELLKKNGHFAQMVKNTGKNAQIIHKIAKGSYKKRNSK